MSACAIDVAGERLWLLPQRAVFWPRQRMLIVADVHFGKAAAFREGGVPVPAGTTAQNLDGLSTLLRTHDVAHIMFLGDFVHARSAALASVFAAIARWREERNPLALTLVRGNHDRHAGDPPQSLGMCVVNEPHGAAPFAFCHHPETAAPDVVMAGHVHPVLRIVAAGDNARLPCFVVADRRIVLPSFGAFTGGFEIDPQPHERVFVVAGDTVLAVPRRASSRRE